MLIVGIGVVIVLPGVAGASPGLAIGIGLGMLLLYAVLMYFLLRLGSWVYMRSFQKSSALTEGAAVPHADTQE